LHQHAGYIQRELAQYLATPHPDDMLDAVIDPNGAPASHRMGAVGS
jgi:hypothetical protein